MNEEQVDLVCISESWERENLTLDEVIKIPDYTVISNVFQRNGKGGRPAIVANNKKFTVENLTQNEMKFLGVLKLYGHWSHLKMFIMIARSRKL